MPSPPAPRSQDEVGANAGTGCAESVGLSQRLKKRDRMGEGETKKINMRYTKKYFYRNSEKILQLKRKKYGKCLETETLRVLNSGDSMYYKDLLWIFTVMN
jgi:hypothetical protein